MEFRKKNLVALRDAVIRYQPEIAAALKKDLHKSEEEAYASETGLFLIEINHTLRNLATWSAPISAKTSFVNIPSTSKIYRDALGVVLVIAPWNYPFQLVMVPAMAAIAAGNCVVIKPSEFAPATAALIQTMISEIFSPEHVMVVQGPGEKLIPPMIKSFRFDHIFYTGSVAVGREIYKLAAEQLIPVTLELGGKSPAIVAPDADLPVAARRITLGKWLNAGQTCIAPDYLVVHESVKEELVSELKKAIIQFYTSEASASYDYGRIINEQRFNKLTSYFNQGNIIYGGDHDKSNLYIGPTLMDNIVPESSIMQDEIFGPLLPVLSYTTTEEAMRIIALNKNPLALYLFTKNKATEDSWIKNTAFGGACINNTAWHFANHHLPFGGVGNSGIGAYHGKYSFDLFSRLKPVMKTPLWFDPKIKYPSFKGRLKLLKWLFR
jgi:aldehyde dehydrogenase (NAD+)